MRQEIVMELRANLRLKCFGSGGLWTSFLRDTPAAPTLRYSKLKESSSALVQAVDTISRYWPVPPGAAWSLSTSCTEPTLACTAGPYSMRAESQHSLPSRRSRYGLSTRLLDRARFTTTCAPETRRFTCWCCPRRPLCRRLGRHVPHLSDGEAQQHGDGVVR